MRTSIESFKIGLAAFVVPFMFFYSPSLLMRGDWFDILHVFVTASLGGGPPAIAGDQNASETAYKSSGVRVTSNRLPL